MLKCAPNFRDIGGLQTADGRQVRPLRLFRSEAILEPSPADMELLCSLSLGLVLDLRSASEAYEFPNAAVREVCADVRQLNIGTDVKARGTFWDVLAQDCSPASVEALVHKIYRAIPAAVAPALAVYFNHVAEHPEPTLMHCTAGKDRTGVAVALVLEMLGVTREAIVADYLATEQSITSDKLEDSARKLAEIAGRTLPDESLRMLAGVRADFLEQSYAWIERKHLSAEAFLIVNAGLTESKMESLRGALLEAAPTAGGAT